VHLSARYTSRGSPGERGSLMLTFERTTDYNLIRAIMTHPRVYPAVSDDASPAAADFWPVQHPSFWYVLARDRYCGYSVDLGLWLFVPQNAVCWEVHTCLLPKHGYRRAREAARELAGWIWGEYGVPPDHHQRS
jgi:hypothetical protein